MLRSIIHDLISSGRNDWTRDSGKKFNKTGQETEERETGNLAQPNLDGISCIISNIQFHLEKKPDKSPERERVKFLARRDACFVVGPLVIFFSDIFLTK